MSSSQRVLVTGLVLVLAVVMAVASFASVDHDDSRQVAKYALFWCGIPLSGVCLFLAGRRALRREENLALSLGELAGRRLDGAIVLASFLSLFFELLLIRYQASLLPIIAYFKNISLLACFLGLGIGFALGDRQPIRLSLFAFLLLFQTAFLYGAHLLLPRILNPITENLAMGLGVAWTKAGFIYSYSFLTVIFVTTALVFIPLGQMVSFLMSRQQPLKAYSFNLIGSLLGIAGFSLISALSTPPLIWFLASFLVLLWFVPKPSFSLGALLLGCAGVCAIEGINPNFVAHGFVKIFSPYQVLSLDFRSRDDGSKFYLMVNHDYFQRVFNLSTEGRERNAMEEHAAAYYEFPYLFKEAPERVLVVGAGTGNDVAGALRKGAWQIDAVEIDPVIMNLGRRYHPEHPYKSPRVHSVVNDARTYMKRCAPGTYDLIVYGLLDSHTLLSNLSNVRLDSFVYTVEALEDARRLLKDDGIVSLTFNAVNYQQGRKIFKMLREAFPGYTIRAYLMHFDKGVAYVVGHDLPTPPLREGEFGMEDYTSFYSANLEEVDASTDDWPFLYMQKRVYPRSYLLMNIILLLTSFLMIAGFFPRSGFRLNVEFFALGAGFMLIETRGITQLGLSFGNTWYVIALMIGAILVLAYLANHLSMRVPRISVGACYLALLALLACDAALDVIGRLGKSSMLLAPCLQLIVLTLPLFFSGLVFSRELKRHGSIAVVFSSNLLGSMLGGLLEYSAMFTGYHSLSWFGLGVYALACVSWLVNRKRLGA